MLNQIVKVIRKKDFVPTKHRKPTEEELRELVLKSEAIITKQRKRINRLLSTNDFLLEQRRLCEQNQMILNDLAELRDAIKITLKNDDVNNNVKIQMIAGAMKTYNKKSQGGANEMFRQESKGRNGKPQQRIHQ